MSLTYFADAGLDRGTLPLGYTDSAPTRGTHSSFRSRCAPNSAIVSDDNGTANTLTVAEVAGRQSHSTRGTIRGTFSAAHPVKPPTEFLSLNETDVPSRSEGTLRLAPRGGGVASRAQ